MSVCIKIFTKGRFQSSEGEVHHLFSTLVLSNFTYGLPIYGAIDSDLTVIQTFMDRCFKRKYTSTCERMDIRELLEKADKKIFKVRSVDPDCPLSNIILKFWILFRRLLCSTTRPPREKLARKSIVPILSRPHQFVLVLSIPIISKVMYRQNCPWSELLTIVSKSVNRRGGVGTEG